MSDIKLAGKRTIVNSNQDSKSSREGRISWWRSLGFLALSGVLVLGVWGLWGQKRTETVFELPPNSELTQPDEQFFARAKTGNKIRPPVEGDKKNDAPSLAGGYGQPSGQPEKQIAVAKNEQLIDHINEGVRFLKEGDLDQAVDRFERALEADPKSEDAHFNLGITYGRKGKIGEAIQHYKKAIELMPDYAEACNNLGNLYASQKRFEEAVHYLSTAIKIMPGYASAHNNYGTVLVRMGQLKEAADRFQEAVRLMPEYVEAHFNLANTWLQLNQNEKALVEYRETLRLRPGFEPALRALSKLQSSERMTTNSASKQF